MRMVPHLTIDQALRRLEDQRYAIREDMDRGTDADQVATSLICALNLITDLLVALDEKDRESGS